MDFDQLRTFLEVAKQGSFSRAGQKVFRSQSAVSAQIRQIESEYGERLLDRSRKTVRLTPAREVFPEYAHRLPTLRREPLPPPPHPAPPPPAAPPPPPHAATPPHT